MNQEQAKAAKEAAEILTENTSDFELSKHRTALFEKMFLAGYEAKAEQSPWNITKYKSAPYGIWVYVRNKEGFAGMAKFDDETETWEPSCGRLPVHKNEYPVWMFAPPLPQTEKI